MRIHCTHLLGEGSPKKCEIQNTDSSAKCKEIMK